MKTKTWNFENKSTWGDGEWMQEPDKIQWVDPDTEMACLVRRGPSGALCGYVGVGKAHPLYGVGYSSCTGHCEEAYCDYSPECLFEVHGGLTYSAFCAEDEEHGICHVVEPGEEEPLWWFGFDCAHAGDLCPSHKSLGGRSHQPYVYRNLSYVQSECMRLAQQLKQQDLTHQTNP